jgi:hypothetical protein
MPENEGMTNITGNPYEEYIFIKTAAATGYTLAQVRTIARCERETERAYANECRMARRGDPFTPEVEDFQVEHDERLSLPRVTYYDFRRGFMDSGVAVLPDGSLDRNL